jgi:hypothetical protein
MKRLMPGMDVVYGGLTFKLTHTYNMKKIYLLALVVLGFSADSFAQTSATATATATIITPIGIANNADLSFGNIAVNPTAAGGSVTLPASINPARTVTGGVTLPTISGTVQAAKFTVTGSGSTAYSISIPAISLSNGTNSMALVPNCSTSLTTGALSGGTETFYVGGVLTVGATQAVGAYTGTVTVTVNYN